MLLMWVYATLGFVSVFQCYCYCSLHFDTLIDLVGCGYTIGYGNMPYHVLLAWNIATAPQYI